MNKIIITLILIISAFLLFFRIPELMRFIDDQAWFYLSARDLLLTGEIPLVGITASHTWLHQGPMWTYLLAGILWIFKFNPLGGAYFTAFFGIVSVYLIYKIGSNIFSKRVGIVAALLYATSPLIIIHSRMAYHTSIIPLFVLIFIYLLFIWIKGNVKIFPLIILCLAILYNLELASVVLVFILLSLLFFGFIKKKEWVTGLINRKILILSFLMFIVIMFPILIYDFSHGFPQTVKFALWIPYRLIKIFIDASSLENSSSNMSSMFQFFFLFFNRLIFLPNAVAAFFIFILSTIFIVYKICIKQGGFSYKLIFFLFLIPFVFFLINQTPSEAYLPIIFPQTIIIISIFFDELMNKKILKISVISILLFLSFTNAHMLITKNYLMNVENGYGPSYVDKIKIAKEIVRVSNKKSYNIISKDIQYQSINMSYEYLAWYLGNGPSKEEHDLKFLIEEDSNNIHLSIVRK